uniref:Uncharacterized protein n=1 Tax=Brassica oleracea var. oleracea TaxID=109376 RepID=A0A0D3AS04_BRAOL
MPQTVGNPLGFSFGNTSEYSCKTSVRSLGISGAMLEEEAIRVSLYTSKRNGCCEHKDFFTWLPLIKKFEFLGDTLGSDGLGALSRLFFSWS